MTGVDDLHARLVAFLSAELLAALRGAVRPGAEPQELLTAAEALGRAVTREVYRASTELAAEREAAPSCDECGKPMRRHQRLARVVCHLGGDLQGVYQRWRCRACRQGACPSYTGFIRFGCTPAAREVALQTCARLPFEVAERHLGRVGLHLSDNTLQRLTHALGGERAAGRRAEAEAVMNLCVDLTPEEPPERLYIQVDGYKVKVEGRWREARVGVVYEAERVPADQRAEGEPKARPERVSVVAALADCDAFAPLLTAEAQRRGSAGVQEVVLIADGANWIWERLRSLVPIWAKVVEVLDWYHLVENLQRAVRAAYGEAGNGWWLEQLKSAAWAGDSNELLRLLESLQAKATSEEAAAEARRVVNYVREHRGRMNYEKLDFEGYHVGSGVVESRCKQVGQRTKGPGMDWSEDGLNAVLCVLADDLTDPKAVRERAA